MESIMEHCAKILGKDPTDFKVQNLYKKGQVCYFLNFQAKININTFDITVSKLGEGSF